jgi:tetratricopeptide (TPR) repeat protein
VQQNRDDRQQGREERRGDRQENREQIRDDWQQQRDDLRQNWQDYRDQAYNDWQGWFGDHYGGLYGSWYGGYAPGYWGQSDYLWDSWPVAAAAGLTWWGANALGYEFGYSDYYNPYYSEGMPAYYSEPIVTEPVQYIQETTVTAPAAPPATVPAEAVAPAAAPPPTAAAPPPTATSEAVSKFDQARAAFLDGQYESALKLTDTAIAQKPHDAVLHEFRALVLFALGRYAEAAATIHAVLDVGPGWDWKTLSGLYPSTDVYARQLRALESARDKDPKAADVHFLLGYHYLTCGNAEEALSEFRGAAEQQPKDRVAASLVAQLAPRDAQPAPAPPKAAPKAVPPDSVAGSWKAAGKGTYAMNLNKDGTFTWGFTRDARKQEVKGVYTVEDNVLAMEPDSGGVMLAELTLKEPDALHFKMIGGAADDPGLDFRREPAKSGK